GLNCLRRNGACAQWEVRSARLRHGGDQFERRQDHASRGGILRGPGGYLGRDRVWIGGTEHAEDRKARRSVIRDHPIAREDRSAAPRQLAPRTWFGLRNRR